MSVHEVVIDLPPEVYNPPKCLDTCYYGVCITVTSVVLCVVVVLLVGLAIEEQSFGAYLGLGMFVICVLVGVFKFHFGE